MDGWDAGLLTVAAAVAGAVNAVVGSGSLITFPALVAMGYPPILATVSNNVGLVPGMAGAVYGYRRELAGQGQRLWWLASAAGCGAVIGSSLLLCLPASWFRAIVPVLIGAACVLVLVQPFLSRRPDTGLRRGGVWLWLGVFGTGIYGGYFGAAQGVVLIGLLGALTAEHLQRLNALKNALALTVNLVAAIVFVGVTTVEWRVVLIIAAGSTLGGVLGSRYGRSLSPAVLRAAIVAVGVLAMVDLVARGW
ncbi:MULTISPECIES: sulfite exporter TauE/SafE family protein [Streptomyces]|uniref:sulfite exporter TauE/SafE family protein n=1 Tax=Streptomyces TaxID=1883 RepID=UPI001E62409E|nr:MULTISPECIES: TSUP family transporter [Streptomyces]UFQ19076.1 sulfite exporter TauE/SafE family protein [Streptomyces huasconensis]WCL88695.1 sulfite exporter TauE/SafE family protein [Streptomyces sp. JCM 35825]